jgi:hypothetical protein
MKSISVISLSVLLLAACTTPVKKENFVAQVSVSHTAIMGISAFYYCANKYWPSSIEVIRDYESTRQVMSHVKIQWAHLTESAVYSNDPEYRVVSTVQPQEGKAVEITSGQSAPLCKGKNVNLQGAYVNM